MAEEKVQLPQPLGSYILIKNPIEIKGDEMEKELGKLPEKDRQEYIQKHLIGIWHNVEVLGVGPDVRTINKGDKVMTTAEAARTQALTILEDKYLMLREANFVGKW